VVSDYFPDNDDSHYHLPVEFPMDEHRDYSEDYDQVDLSEGKIRNLSNDPAYKRMFDVKTLSKEENDTRQAEAIDAFQRFQTKQFRELFMPSKGDEPKEAITKIFKPEKVFPASSSKPIE